MDKCFIEFNQRQIRKEQQAARRRSLFYALGILSMLIYIAWFTLVTEICGL